MPIAKLGAVVLDAPDPAALAEFYAALLGGTTTVQRDGVDIWVEVEHHGGTTLAFQAAPDYVPPKWPSTDGDLQFHLDLTVDDLDAAQEQVLALGATVLDAADTSRTWRVYADPAGHPFCLCSC